jgi:Flp pilus assembly pilin Flp
MQLGVTAEGGLPLARSARASSERQKEKQMKRLIGYVKDQRGVETLEWIVVGALIVAVGIAVYTGALQGQLVTAVNTIGGTIQGLASS